MRIWGLGVASKSQTQIVELEKTQDTHIGSQEQYPPQCLLLRDTALIIELLSFLKL